MRNVIPNPHDPNFGKGPIRAVPVLDDEKNITEEAPKSVLQGYRPVHHESINPNIKKIQEDQFSSLRNNNGGVVDHNFKAPMLRSPIPEQPQYGHHPENIIPPAPIQPQYAPMPSVVPSVPQVPYTNPVAYAPSKPIAQNNFVEPILPPAPQYIPPPINPVIPSAPQVTPQAPVENQSFIKEIIEGTPYPQEHSGGDRTEAAPTILSVFSHEEKKPAPSSSGIRRAKGYVPQTSGTVKFMMVILVVGISIFLVVAGKTVITDTKNIIDNIQTQTEAKQKARALRKSSFVGIFESRI